ncbi:MAG: hypothetical protein WBE90_29040 [Xanthobacteraceae bacterium]
MIMLAGCCLSDPLDPMNESFSEVLQHSIENGQTDCDVQSELAMTGDNSIRDTVSANDGASKSTVTIKNSIARDAKVDVANCSDFGQAAASSESAIIEEVARLAKRYAAGPPSDAELRALGAKLISQTSNLEKPASFGRENLARPPSMPSSQNPWVALQAHVGGRVRPAKARSRAKRYIPIVLTLAFFMYFVGPIYLDKAYAPSLPGKMDRMVGPATTVVPTKADGEPGASGGHKRVAYRQGCETGWNVIPPEQHCVSDSLWDQPEELFGGYRAFDPRTAFSTSPDQFLTSWARIAISQDGAAFQIPGSLGAARSAPANEHSTVEQQPETSTKRRDERLPSRANLPPLPQARPKSNRRLATRS